MVQNAWKPTCPTQRRDLEPPAVKTFFDCNPSKASMKMWKSQQNVFRLGSFVLFRFCVLLSSTKVFHRLREKNNTQVKNKILQIITLFISFSKLQNPHRHSNASIHPLSIHSSIHHLSIHPLSPSLLHSGCRLNLHDHHLNNNKCHL